VEAGRGVTQGIYDGLLGLHLSSHVKKYQTIEKSRDQMSLSVIYSRQHP
jgi:hypothetical protein